MRILFLTLVLGVLCAAQELQSEDVQSDVAEAASSDTAASSSVSEWKAMFVAFSSSDETTKICLPQCFICKIEFDETNAIITFTICDRLNGKSFQQTIKGIETLEGTYAIDCDCKNKVKITQLSKNVLLVTAVCVDTDGNITIVVELLGTGDCVLMKYFQTFLEEFNNLLSTYGLTEENAVFISCPDCDKC